jgi:AcrR family transcriptional regulator
MIATVAAKRRPPTDLELLWGDVEPPRRGPKPTLSLDAIAESAIAIADAEGLEAVSKQRVAAELGYTTMSLYRYVPSKELLVEIMLDRASGRPPAAPDSAGWRAELEGWVRGLWEVYERHPWILQVQLAGPPVGPNQFAWFEAALQPLSRAGIGVREMISTAMFLVGATRELARISLEVRAARERAGVAGADAGTRFAAALQRYADAEHYPLLAAMVADHVFDQAGEGAHDVDVDLGFGLQRLIDGIEAYAGRA